jgi:hypothetical protein
MERRALICGALYISLAYSVMHGCGLSADQFVAAHILKTKLEPLRGHVERQGVGV